MENIADVIQKLGEFLPILKTAALIIAIFLFFDLLINFVKKRLLKKVKAKKLRSNVEIFSRVSKYVVFLILVFVGIFSYAGSWTGLGLGLGLFSAALGWALQKPITGIAAWIMIVFKRPFILGDRVIIGNVRGDVADISLTHIYLKEIGGIVPGEESSGRIIMIPNSLLFEQNIINYTSKNEFVLDQVSVPVTYESNLGEAIKISLKAAKKHSKEAIEKTEKEPYIRTFFDPRGIKVNVRYFAPAKNLQEISSNITQEIYKLISKSKRVRIAYPHTEVILKKQKSPF